VDVLNLGGGDGSPEDPFPTLGQGHAAARDGTRLLIQAGDYPEVLLLNKIVRLEPRSGTVRLGKP
jgi:hypothetical protein